MLVGHDLMRGLFGRSACWFAWDCIVGEGEYEVVMGEIARDEKVQDSSKKTLAAPIVLSHGHGPCN